MTFKPLILGVALAFPLAMVGQTTPNTSSRMANSDQNFVQKLAQEDMSEINLAHLALKKSSNPKVQSYAKKKILAADPNMEQQAKNIARQNNVKVPNSPSAKEQAEYNKLSNMSGRQFDRAYMNYESRKQEKDLDLVQHEISTTNNSRLKNYAQQEETPVRSAYQKAHQIASSATLEASTRR